MNKQVVNTFLGGMNKDTSKSLLTPDKYLDANNYRLITTKGSTTGSLENVKGNKLIVNTITSAGVLIVGHNYLVLKAPISYNATPYNPDDTFTAVIGQTTFTGTGIVLDITAGLNFVDGHIIGGVEIRDSIILFVTANHGTTPNAAGSRIYKLTLDLVAEAQSTLTLLYDDELNDDGSFLNFSTSYPIKAIAKYETPNVQKVYWTDGYNNLRFANIAANLTMNGLAYPTSAYVGVDKFEMLPKFDSMKPVLKDIITGNIDTGIVAYAYQLYNVYGASTSYSILSDPISVVSDGDFKSNTRSYKGNATKTNSGKGFVISIDNDANTGYNRLRLIRVHYEYLNSNPTIAIANEVEISPAGGEVLINDTGDNLGFITIDEFTLSSTELFSCEDIAAKDNRLFAANITKNEFDVDAWDARAVRFRHWRNPADVDTDTYNYTGADIDLTTGYNTISYVDPDTVEVTIGLFSVSYSNHPGIVTNVTGITSSPTPGTVTIGGLYEDDILGTGQPWEANEVFHSFTNLSYDEGTDLLTFRVNNTAANYYVNNWVVFETAVLYSNLTFTYEYSPWTEDAEVYDSADSLTTPVVITEPLSDTPAAWDTAGWDDYVATHDGINKFNDPDNDGDLEYKFIYQSNCSTPGAEGPNIKIDFETDDFLLDTSNDDSRFYVTPPTDADDLSYKNYASPWKGGKLSWQRDEVYRLFVVFGNDRGQLSDPKWITDLRMPSLHDADANNSSSVAVKASVLADEDGGTGYVTSYRLYPRVWFKSFPANATFAQIHRVKRDRKDRFVVTQGFAVPCKTDVGVNIPNFVDQNLSTTNAIIKLVSPEINVNKNISLNSTDYLEYATSFASGHNSATDSTMTGSLIHKLVENTRVVYGANCKTTIADAANVTPTALNSGAMGITLNGLLFNNYYNDATYWGKGGSGLAIAYDNGSWTAEGTHMAIVNYKSNVFGSQYGGYTYEDRQANISIPCSDRLVTTGAWHDIPYGDTFINYFDYSSILAELSLTALSTERMIETIYIPLESSINCDLRHDIESRNRVEPDVNYNAMLRQEYAGTHVGWGTTNYVQTQDLYVYNTVYSQQIDLQPAISFIVDKIMETEFDCMIKASNMKSNGEIIDSWSLFGINEFIEVDSIYGPINAITNFNNKLLYFQDKGTGVVAVNDRSLIQDSNSAQLVLGTGSVLDRYDYMSNLIGCKDKFSVVAGVTALFWYDRVNNFIIQFSQGLDKISMSKGIQSYLNTNVLSTQSVVAHPDINNNEILFTFYILDELTNLDQSFTLVYSENVEAFTAFYTFIPNLYIPYKNRYLTTTRSKYNLGIFHLNYLYLGDSEINSRCNFYGRYLHDTTAYDDSTIKLLFNQDYMYTKTFDDLLLMCNVYDPTTDTIELYNQSINSIRCYNEYQNTDWVTLTYKTNLERRERGWTTVVPRNLVSTNLTSNPNIFDPGVLASPSRTFRERMRDKYMILDTKYTNSAAKKKIVIDNISAKYRISYR